MVPRLAGLIVAAAVATGSAQVGSIPESARTAQSYVDEGARDLQARRNAEAVAAFRRAIELDPRSAAAYTGLGSAYYRLGRIPDSVSAFDNALALDPLRAPSFINRAISLGTLGRASDALADLARARQLASGNAGMLNQIAIVLLDQFNSPDEALAVYREAAAADPSSAIVFHNIGLLEAKRGRYADAIEGFATAVHLDPSMRNAWFFLGDSHSRLQHYGESTDAWTHFLALVPDGPDATANRAWDYACWGGHGALAAADARRFLTVVGWAEPRSSYMALIGYIGLREAGHADDARLLLDEAAVKLSPRAWPFPVIRYLRGALSEHDVLRAADTNDKETEARAYIGVRLMLDGNASAAREHLSWVVMHGNHAFREFALATRALAGM
jgi:tetratricopeptide (TPR) repeat protein